MILFITTINSQHKLRKFSCWLTNKEVSFDFRSLIAADEQLVDVELLDANKRIKLPGHVFKSAPFSTSILQLERQPVLGEPVN